MGPSLGTSLGNTFLAQHEQNWLNSCSLQYGPWYYRWYVDDIFLLFKSSDHLKQFQSYFSSCHVNLTFKVQIEQNKKISFLDVNIICEQGKVVTSIYRKPTFSGVCTRFDSFLPDTHKIGMIYTLFNRCFWICTSWTMFINNWYF